MEFKEIEIKNFLSFYGVQRITFPATKDDAPALILVMAINTAGKTNLIRAMRFMLYGDLCGEDQHPERLVNDRSFQELSKGEIVDSWVQIKVDHQGHQFTFRRSILVLKSGSGNRSFRLQDFKLGEVKHGARGDDFFEDEGVIRRALNKMVPAPLFDYFFFEGETLAQKLLDGGASAKGIRAGLSSLLHDFQWRDAYNISLKIRDTVSKQLKSLTAKDEAYNRLVSQLELIQLSIEKKRKERDEAIEKRDDAAQRADQADNLLEELASGRDLHKIVTAHKAAIEALELEKQAISKCKSDIARELGMSKGLTWLQNSFYKSRELLEDMREQNLLPADVSEAFITRLLESNACICGNSFEGDEGCKARERWDAYRKFTLSVDVNSALQQLANRLEVDSMVGFDSQITSSNQKLAKIIEELDLHTVALEDCKQREKITDQELENSNIEQIQQARSQQRLARRDYNEAIEIISNAESSLKQLKYQEKQKNIEIKQAGKNGQAVEAVRLHNKMQRAAELATFIDEARSQVMSAFHRKLQDTISQYYDPVVADNTKAKIDARTLLPAVEADGQVRKNIGGSQRQLLVLSHIVSLSQLRQWLYAELANVGIMLGTLDEQTFMLDSIFGPLSDNYRRECARFIPGKVKQLILMATSDQWDDIVREEIEPHVTKAYRLIKSTTNSDIVQGETPTQYKGKKYKQARQLPKDELDYTVIEEVK